MSRETDAQMAARIMREQAAQRAEASSFGRIDSATARRLQHEEELKRDEEFARKLQEEEEKPNASARSPKSSSKPVKSSIWSSSSKSGAKNSPSFGKLPGSSSNRDQIKADEELAKKIAAGYPIADVLVPASMTPEQKKAFEKAKQEREDENYARKLAGLPPLTTPLDVPNISKTTTTSSSRIVDKTPNLIDMSDMDIQSISSSSNPFGSGAAVAFANRSSSLGVSSTSHGRSTSQTSISPFELGNLLSTGSSLSITQPMSSTPVQVSSTLATTIPGTVKLIIVRKPWTVAVASGDDQSQKFTILYEGDIGGTIKISKNDAPACLITRDPSSADFEMVFASLGRCTFYLRGIPTAPLAFSFTIAGKTFAWRRDRPEAGSSLYLSVPLTGERVAICMRDKTSWTEQSALHINPQFMVILDPIIATMVIMDEYDRAGVFS